MATKLNHISKANVLCQSSFKLNGFIILASPPIPLKEKYFK